MIETALSGAGRIRAANLVRQPGVRRRDVVDVFPDAPGEVAALHGTRFTALTERIPIRTSNDDGERALAPAGVATRSWREGRTAIPEDV